MKAQLKILCQLQQLDQQKTSVMNQKAKIDSDEVRHLWQEIRLLAQNVTANKQKLGCLETVCADQEAELAAVTRQCQQLEAKLYGGEITNLKEMEQAKENCERLRNDISRRENEAFASIEAGERITAQIADDEAMLEQKKRLHTEKQQLFSRALAGFDSKLAEIEAEHSQLASQVEIELMHRYRELKRKMPAPVAAVANGACGGCRMSIPTNQILLARSALVCCDNCGRILLAD